MRERLRHAPELLDGPAPDMRLLEQSLDHVAQVNRFLGGDRAALAAISHMIRPGSSLRVLDIGTGAAGIPRAIVAAARRVGADIHVTAADIHPQVREIAAARCRGWPEITIEAADALELPYADASFDAALLTLTLHHFEDDDPVRALREAARVARLVVVNELDRTRLNYAGARILAATWWRANPITRHDGPLSVLRAFNTAELCGLAERAGLSEVRIRKPWFSRLLLTARGAR